MPTIEVFADIGCPFAHVGLRRLRAERDRRGSISRLRVRPWPLELVNGVPMDAEFIDEEIDDIRAQVAPELFAGFRVEAFPSTFLPAMAVVEAAYRVDDESGEALSFAMRTALFEEGRNVGDEEVLAELSETQGVGPVTEEDRQAVLDSWEEGRRRGVIGSPHFFAGDGGVFCPTLDIRRTSEGHLRISAGTESFDAFVESCFAGQ